MGVKIKICGITNADDALAAASAGADLLGFIFYEGSPRFLSFKLAREIILRLPPSLSKVGVFVNAPEDLVRRAIEECGIDTLQFHGDESPAFCQKFGRKSIKAFRIKNFISLNQLAAYKTDAWLFDSYAPGKAGGTGAQFNWQLAREAAQLGGRIILAGGLRPENVRQAVRQVRPFAVDVCSGVESEPGRKDLNKVRQFIQAVRDQQ